MVGSIRVWIVLALLGIGVPAGAETEASAAWPTPAERSEFRATPTYDETLDTLHALAEKWDAIRIGTFGVSAEGRPLPLVIVANDGAFTPEAAAASGRAIVMIQNGIHGGEIDGKDACLMLLRDMALGRHREVLDEVILLIVPIYNVDGHERISPHNRPNQDGPVEGMGFRTTADGHDLNRDHLKLATPEARQLIRLVNEWQPHLHVDNHVTDGSDHDWVLTYAWAEAPQLAAPLDRWMKGHMPAVLAATERAGFRVGPYVDLIDRGDPSKGFNSYVGSPRYSSGYFPLRNVPSILVENHSYKPYEQRVRANHAFLRALIREVHAGAGDLTKAVDETARRTVALGAPDAEPSEVVLRFRAAEATEEIAFPIYDWYSDPSIVMGTPLLRYRRGQVREIRAPWKHRAEPVATTSRPRGYLVLPGWPAIENRLVGHGLRFERLTKPVELEVETLRLSGAQQTKESAPSYQGLTLIDVDVARRLETRTFAEGTLWIPADQPDFEVAVQLLEPEATDSLLRWGLLSLVLERKEYIEPAVLEDLARKLLENEETAREWKQALEDAAFAANPWRRWEWWYRRTEFWDSTRGLMPVMRVLSPPSFAALSAEP